MNAYTVTIHNNGHVIAVVDGITTEGGLSYGAESVAVGVWASTAREAADLAHWGFIVGKY